MPRAGVTTVLVVAGDTGDARLVHAALRSGPRECAVERVERLSSALARVREHSPDVVVLDLDLPDGDGLDTLVVLRTRAPLVPIVVLIGEGAEAGSRALRSGAGAYLVKGEVTAAGVLAALDSAVARQRVRNEVQANH